MWEDHVRILMLKKMIIIQTGEWDLWYELIAQSQMAVDNMVIVNYKDLYGIELKKKNESLEKFI